MGRLQSCMVGLGPSCPKLSDTYRRMFLALMVNHVTVSTAPRAVWEAARRFNVPRGELQGLLSAAATQTHSLANFTREIKVGIDSP